jgi:hypothetical protein
VHPDGDVTDAGPRVEPGAQRPERKIIRAREPGESECCWKKLAALVEHALFDDLICTYQHRLRDRQAERLRSLEIDDQLVFGGLLHR